MIELRIAATASSNNGVAGLWAGLDWVRGVGEEGKRRTQDGALLGQWFPSVKPFWERAGTGAPLCFE